MEEEFYDMFKDNSSFKNRLFKYCRLFVPVKNNDPILKLLSNNIKIFYNLKDDIIDKSQTSTKLKFAKYLNFYIYAKDKQEILKNKNFMNYITELNKYQESISNGSLKKIILSKIIIELINIHIKINDGDNSIDIEELTKIKNNNIEIIKNNNNVFSRYDLDINEQDIISMDVDEIYKKIIITLIKKNKLAENIKIYNIINQLEFGSINIIGTIFDEICEVLNTNGDYIKENAITDIKDFSDPKKLNFYFILLKYILKSSIYIYNVNFLLKTHQIIRAKLNLILSSIKDNPIKEKILFIVREISDTEYKPKKKEKEDLSLVKEKEIFKYYYQFLPVTKKKEIMYLKNEVIDKKKKLTNQDILKDYDIAVKMNDRAKLINFLGTTKETMKKKLTEKEISEHIKLWNKLEKLINKKQFKKMKRVYKSKIAFFFADPSKKDMLLKIFDKDLYEYILEKSIEFFNVEKINNGIDILNKFNEKDKNKDKNNIKPKEPEKKKIEIKKDESISLMDSSRSKNKTEIVVEECYIYNSSMTTDKSLMNQISETSDIKFKIEFVSLIGKHRNRAEFIRNINEDFYISGGGDKKLIIYDSKFEKYSEFQTTNWICNFYYYEQTREKLIIACSKKNYFKLKLQNNIKTISFSKEAKASGNNSYLNFIKLNNEKYLICGINNLEIVSSLFDEFIHSKNIKLYNDSYKGGLYLDDELVVLTSNSILMNGNDKLFFLNLRQKLIMDEIKGYSFVTTVNGITRINKDENILLLCACKKYLSNQKNGILLVTINKGKKKYQFFETDNFEVYCFCHIIYKIKVYILDDKKNKIYETDYFFVGGYDKDIKKGVIKLYKIICEDNNYKIEYVTNVNLENYEGFNSAVSCIYQDKGSDKLLITNLDGRVFHFVFDLKFILSLDKDEDINITI